MPHKYVYVVISITYTGIYSLYCTVTVAKSASVIITMNIIVICLKLDLSIVHDYCIIGNFGPEDFIPAPCSLKQHIH